MVVVMIYYRGDYDVVVHSLYWTVSEEAWGKRRNNVLEELSVSWRVCLVGL